MKIIVLSLILIISNYLVVYGQKQNYSPEDHIEGTQTLSSLEIEQFRQQMLNQAVTYFQQELKSSPEIRDKKWKRNFNSHQEYLKSISQNRERFKKIIGVIDKRTEIRELSLIVSTNEKSLISENDLFKIFSVSWPVLEGITGVGLWLEPKNKVTAQIIAIPDADWHPEMIAGLSPDLPFEVQYARKLASAGCRVIVPVLINRECTFSGNPDITLTNQPHREFLYRRAYEVGRHIIGYEVQKVLALVDWFTYLNNKNEVNLPIAVAGYGEGGLLSLYSAAIDQRIDGVMVSGYFQEREEIWKEPIYRNVWGLLDEFGDAEIASLIAPRKLVVEACKGPIVEGPPLPDKTHKNVAAPGRLISPPLESVIKEIKRAEKIYNALDISKNSQLIINNKGGGLPGSTPALNELLNKIGVESNIPVIQESQLKDYRSDFSPVNRMKEQFTEIQNHLDNIISNSSLERQRFWSKADFSSLEQWEETTESFREHFSKELMGEMPPPSESPNPRSRLIYETSKWKGYWVKLDVWPEMMTGGILLIPKDIKSGEKRPLIVCQHGLGGYPESLVDTEIESVYHAYGAQLADLGYVVYVPQHIYGLMPNQPYGKRDFRIIQRMANPLKKSIYSVVIGNEKQAMNWLKKLPFIDSERIALYGLSYGGKTAMRVPVLLNDYAVVICSGDFNQWVWKTTSMNFNESYLYLPEYEMYEFNLANIFNYAEMAGLIAPRPFMVERGHWDPVAKDEWVAFEYAKVRRLYTRLGVGDRTTIEYFNGPHEIHGVGTFEFLKKHLKYSSNENH